MRSLLLNVFVADSVLSRSTPSIVEEEMTVRQTGCAFLCVGTGSSSALFRLF